MSIGIERKWPAVAPQLFTADGTPQGIVTVADARGFKVKQAVVIIATGLPQLRLQVKRFISPTEFIVGPISVPQGQNQLNARQDISAYTIAKTSFVYAEEQDKVVLKPDDITQATYEQEPANAIRSYVVDYFGQGIDSTLGSDGKNRLAVDADVTVNNLQLLDKPYDSGTETYPSATQEVVTTYIGGLSGTPVQQIVLNYSDSTKNNLVNFERSNWNGSTWVVG